ncbi:hypothetical protein EPUS_03386 [Endocarpon pusillum Z07020]|uniref:HMG box domain-containing protein n=1 Tax=Endocarpon pusillum (strain Z07020 / HMAS-L-300199) TaxID=1263415 RepID=U1GQG3_ENDPU|nr:uncharacterized protein EPUS_03386 [Endocarpon pusillum Z07020]ERF74196.1 hypothetical protein EPUS_03386 [Endocarpon pusillum Z07020]
MHFALPPRKTSQPPPYARASRKTSYFRQQQLRLVGYIVCGILTIYLLFHYVSFSDALVESAPPGTPPVVIVTVLDEQHMSDEYITNIRANRKDYAARQGYENFFTSVANYTRYTEPSPSSWTLIPALRHALTKYPHSTHFFSLSPYALIMSPSLSLEEHVLAPAKLESVMRKDVPVVPPDSVIHTFSHLKGNKVDLVLTQDTENLGHGSFILRRGEWAKFFLDTWFNPLYRTYNFQKAEGHALEHIVQWHPTILAKMALVPQRLMNSYSVDVRPAQGKDNDQLQTHNALFQDGDLLVHFYGCRAAPERDCEREMKPYYEDWQREVQRLDDPKIPRPRNAFILYRQHHQAAVVAKHPGLPNPEISKIIGEEWRALPTKTKNQWKALAEEEKLRHQQQYPDYRYQPRRFGRNGNPQTISTINSTGPSGNCLRCGGKTMNPPVTPNTPLFPNGGPSAGMIRSPSTVNTVAGQPSRRPHPLAHANLHRQVPYTVSSPPPPGSALARVRPFSEVFAGGVPPSMSEAEYRARFAKQPMSPDPKRRRFNGPGVMVPPRGADLTSPTAAYSGGPPYSPRRVSLPRPADGVMHPVHQRAVAQSKAQRSNYPPQQPRYASVDVRDPNLTLAPLRTPSSAAASAASTGSKSTSSGATAEAQIMSIPAVNKLRLLAKAAPPLPHPGVIPTAKSPLMTSHSETRGAILAIEGSEEDVRVVTDWLAEFLRNESEEFIVRAFLGPDISSVMAEASGEDEADMVGTQQQRYLKTISEWHWVSKEVVKFVTTAPKAGIRTHNADSGAEERRHKDRNNQDDGMEMDAASSSSPTSAVSPRTITQTERLSLKSPITINDHALNTSPPPPPPPPPTAAAPTPPPPSPSPTHQQNTPPNQPQTQAQAQSQSQTFPIALLPRYQLSTVDTASLTMPITDSYLPIDHWQWAAALWRGCVGADVTIVIQDDRGSGNYGSASSVGSGSNAAAGSVGSGNGSAAGLSGGGGGVEVRLGAGDVRAVIVRKGAVGGGGGGAANAGERRGVEPGAC